MVSQIATGGSTDGRCFGVDRTKQQQWQLTVCGSLVGSQSRPWFVPRARNSHSSLTCDRQSQRNPPEHKTKAEDNGGMGQQSGLSPVVGSSPARNRFEGFCWGLEPQLLLVQQAEDELQC